MDREKALAAAERAARTAAQVFAAMMITELVKDGASWSSVPTAASVAAFAAFISVLMFVAGPLAPRR